ncbi:hypothetical protein C7S16_4853 [Burkholderia thailandensis]|uniref:Uncharacterized protein n=1 Tax=Burkholderia thailandensis TaxID=57975 RepID=A0AAW9CVY7_BURTH|nr:hypothetical protein [Burkholderia thailandensis]MDW9253273.1 hypothetical protein [Burkholderia thailandensis]
MSSCTPRFVDGGTPAQAASETPVRERYRQRARQASPDAGKRPF